MKAGPHPSGLKKAPQTIRRRNAARITAIPAAGRPGPAPKWPLGVPNKAEKARWESLWSRPQAVIWEAMHIEIEVATYVRVSLEAEATLAPRLLAESRMVGDRLLLNPVALFKAQVQIVDDEGELTDENITDMDIYRQAVGGD